MGKKGRPNKYFTEEERKAAHREASRRSYQKHKEKKAEYGKQYRQENLEKINERKNQYNKTPMGRACYLLRDYRAKDKKYKRGECTLTPEWIIDNIFTKKCHWCGETDWKKIGCDRIDNSLPHTPDNVIPCCSACNLKRGKKTYDEYKNALRAKETVL